jgi:hypothetical protein
LEEDIDPILNSGIYGIAVSGLITNNPTESLQYKMVSLNSEPLNQKY